ncbi:MAG: replication-associated recombination protein A [Spirochaetota bacterium]
MNDLFRSSSEHQSLATRCAPSDLTEFFGQDKIVGKDGPLYQFIQKDRMVSCIFWGPPGSGKSALAKIIASLARSEFIRLNAVTAKVDDLRGALKKAHYHRQEGKKTILFIDEIHRFNKMQQDGLLPALEENLVILIGTTTHNPYFYLIPPLRSRVLLFEFKKLSVDSLEKVLQTAEKKGSFAVDQEARSFLVTRANGDARRMLNLAEAAMVVSGSNRVGMQSLNKVIKDQPMLYDRDEDYHYNVISAYIKSIRGSDPDAAIYWLGLMLEAGEDPLFIARRLLILASEDIGLADSFALVLAESAYQAVERIGMPEARIILSHATIYLSLQPKSNSSYTAIEKASHFVKDHPSAEVPSYLRASHYAKKYYKYPHQYKYHVVKQKYTPMDVQFYTPGELGQERELKKRLDFFKQLKSRKDLDAEKTTEEKDQQD